MAVLKLKLGSDRYSIDPNKLTLGESFLLEEEFGVETMGELDYFKAKHLRGLFLVAVKRKHPERTQDEILTEIDSAVTAPVFEDLMKQIADAIQEAERAQDPPPAGVVKTPAGKPRSRRKTAGTPS